MHKRGLNAPMPLEDCKALCFDPGRPWSTSAIEEVRPRGRPGRSSRDVVHEKSEDDEKRRTAKVKVVLNYSAERRCEDSG